MMVLTDKKEIIIGILSILVTGTLIFVVAIYVTNMTNIKFYENCCIENNATYYFIECYNNMIGVAESDRCQNQLIGHICQFPDGHKIKASEVNCSIKNVTSIAS